MIKKCLSLGILFGLIGVGFSTVVGITTTTDNGVLRVTTDQSGLSNALIDSETIVITGSGRIRGDVDVVSSQLKFSGVSTANDANAPFTNGARGTVSALTRVMNTSSLIFETTASRHNIFVSEVSGGSEIIETGLLTNLFVYSQPDAIITDSSFRNIKTHEVYRPFAKFFNVEYIDTETAQLNWEAGRLDRYGINIPSTTSGWFSWIGNGNGGNNAFWDWNPVFIDGTKIIHQGTNNDYYQGYTVSNLFLDKFTNSPVSDVRVVYKDDRTSVGGNLVERGEYFTDGTGVLTGTVDSLDLSVGSNIQRPILYVLTNQSRLTGGTSVTSGSTPNTQNYVLDSVTSELLVRSYLHQANLETLSLSSEVGKIDADLNVVEFSNYFLTSDSGITETDMATVLSYAALDDLSAFYDRAKAEWRDNDDYPVFTGSSSIIDLGSTNLVVNSTSPSVYTYDLPTDTVTIKSNTFVKTAKFSVITTTGNVTIDSSVVNDLETIIPVPVNLTISGLPTAVGSNPLCKFTDNLNLSVSKIFADAGGVATYSTFSDKSVTYVCDALGYERSGNFVVNTGSLGLNEDLSLTEYRDKNGFKLYGNGVAAQMALVTYLDNDKKFYLEYSGANPIISYESFFDKTELLFSGTLGIDYDITHDFSAGRFKINFGSTLKLSPDAGNTDDPEIDFVSYIEGDSNPHTPYVTIGPLRIIYPIVDTTLEKDLDGDYNFLMDELKVLNIALNDSEVALMYKDQLRSLNLDVTVTDYNSTSGDLDFDVTIPFIEKNENLICDFYYSKR